MEIHKQCCNFLLAKKLDELGISSLSFFSYDSNGNLMVTQGSIVRVAGNYSAYTAAELGQILISNIDYGVGVHDYFPVWENTTMNWAFSIDDATLGIQPYFINVETEADARALMLIYLIENNIIKEIKNANRK